MLLTPQKATTNTLKLRNSYIVLIIWRHEKTMRRQLEMDRLKWTYVYYLVANQMPFRM